MKSLILISLYLFVPLISLSAEEVSLGKYAERGSNQDLVRAHFERFDELQAAKNGCSQSTQRQRDIRTSVNPEDTEYIPVYYCSGNCYAQDGKFVMRVGADTRISASPNIARRLVKKACPEGTKIKEEGVRCKYILNGNYSFDLNSPVTKGSESTLEPFSERHENFYFCKSYCRNSNGRQGKEISIDVEFSKASLAVPKLKKKCGSTQEVNLQKIRCAYYKNDEYTFIKIREIK